MGISVMLCRLGRILDGQIMVDVSSTGIELTPGIEACFTAVTHKLIQIPTRYHSNIVLT